MRRALIATSIAALALAATANATTPGLEGVKTTGTGCYLAGGMGGDPLEFRAVKQSTVARFSFSAHSSRYTLSASTKAGALWWRSTGMFDGHGHKLVAWGGRSSNGKGVAPAGVYTMRLVVVDATSVDPMYAAQHTCTSTWQVRVLR